MKSKVRITTETFIWKNEDENGVTHYKDGKEHREDGPAVELKDGTKKWFINGKLHRVDGPAVEGADGQREWWVNGLRHREDGPAVINAEGCRFWLIDGKFHRDDGPAFEGTEGEKQWFLNGGNVSEEEFNQWLMKKTLNDKLHTTLAPKQTEKRGKI